MLDKQKFYNKKAAGSDLQNKGGAVPKEKAHSKNSLNRPAFKKTPLPAEPTATQWNDWHWQVRNQITTVSELEKWIALTVEEKRAIQFSQGRFQFSITPYWASLMDASDFFCPIRRQAIPVDEEFKTSVHDSRDFGFQPVKVAGGRLTHAYPCGAALSIHSQCVVYCRFCPQRKIFEQKRCLGEAATSYPFPTMSEEDWKEAMRYLKIHSEIQELLLTGGEPLLLNDDLLREIFARLKTVPSIKTLRLQTRIVSHLPQRVTASLVKILKDFQPLYLVLHVNHPNEITPEFSQACSLLVDSGIPLASETVLLHEINDKPHILSELFLTLFKLRVRPYRLVQSLPSHGTDHFRTTVSLGLKLVESLRGHMAGLALPEYVVDTAGGKIPLRYESILSRNKKRVLLKNYEGKVFVYPEKIF